MKNDNLVLVSNHIFFKTVIIEKAKLVSGRKGDFDPEYLKKVHFIQSSLTQSFKTLQIARILIAEIHPAVNRYSSSIKPADYVRYNIENYFLRLTTYKDLILKFIDAVYNWKLKTNVQFSANLQKKIKEIQNINLETITISLGNLMQTVNPIRNKIAHEGSINSDIVFIEGADYLKEAIPEIAFDRHGRDVYFKKIIEDNLGEMLKIEEDLGTNLLTVLDVLYPVFNKNMRFI